MSATRRRGLIIFGILVLVGIFGCCLLPFVWMPAWGIGMAMPVITVPGEVVAEDALFGINLTNTLIGTIIADVLVILFAFAAWRASRGWTKEIPGRFQAFAETLVEGFYNFMYNIGGDRLRRTPLLWPLVATIFLFLLFGNLMKLLPGVETVGLTHCAHVGVNGYPLNPGGVNRLWVAGVLDSGIEQTAETEHACEEYVEGHFTRLAVPPDTDIVTVIEGLEAERNVLVSELATVSAEESHEIEEQIEIIEERLESAEQVEILEESVAELRAEVEALRAAETGAEGGEHGEAAAEGEQVEVSGEVVEGSVVSDGQVALGQPDVAEATLDALEAQLTAQEAALDLARTQLQYPHATVALTEEELANGILPYIFHITPFVRGPATDLSLTVALALISVIAIQVYGVWAQGPAYFEKFINITALGNLGKKPMGVIDFLVGVFEIISEISKIVSLAFRLFGNLFAGGVALMAISFLVALVIPSVMYGLELIIGAVQALVFAVLTLVFTVQAMESHHGDEDHAHEEHATSETTHG